MTAVVGQGQKNRGNAPRSVFKVKSLLLKRESKPQHSWLIVDGWMASNSDTFQSAHGWWWWSWNALIGGLIELIIMIMERLVKIIDNYREELLGESSTLVKPIGTTNIKINWLLESPCHIYNLSWRSFWLMILLRRGPQMIESTHDVIVTNSKMSQSVELLRELQQQLGNHYYNL